MRFTILTYESAADFDRRKSEKEFPAYRDGWLAYGAALREAGVMVAGAGLQAIDTATTLRSRDGKRNVQDGPYADTKEQLGGFYIIEVPSLDAALEWAAKCPALPNGAVEVRPCLAPWPSLHRVGCGGSAGDRSWVQTCRSSVAPYVQAVSVRAFARRGP